MWQKRCEAVENRKQGERSVMHARREHRLGSEPLLEVNQRYWDLDWTRAWAVLSGWKLLKKGDP